MLIKLIILKAMSIDIFDFCIFLYKIYLFYYINNSNNNKINWEKKNNIMYIKLKNRIESIGIKLII